MLIVGTRIIFDTSYCNPRSEFNCAVSDWSVFLSKNKNIISINIFFCFILYITIAGGEKMMLKFL